MNYVTYYKTYITLAQLTKTSFVSLIMNYGLNGDLYSFIQSIK